MADEYQYGPDFQASLLKGLSMDPDLFAAAASVARPWDFMHVPARFAWEVLSGHFSKFGSLPGCEAFQDETAQAVDDALSGRESAPEAEIDEGDLPEVGRIVDMVSEGLCSPSNRDSPYWRDRLKEYLAAARLNEMPGDEMSAMDQVKAVERINSELSSLDAMDGASTMKGEDMGIFEESEADNRERIGTGIWGLDRRTAGGGLARGQLGIVVAPSGKGKALVNSDRIPTPSGWRTVGEVREGDMLFDHNGKPIEVLVVHPQQEKKQVWVVTFADGRKIRCCADHNWEYWSKSHRGLTPKVKTTKELYEIMLSHGGCTGSDGRLFKVRNAKAAEYPEKSLPVDPYVLGAFLGNGCAKEKYFAISSGNEFVPSKIARIIGASTCKYSDKNYTYLFKDSRGKLLFTSEVMRGCCEGIVGSYSSEKYIPDEHLTASIEQRLNLLNGLLDTDGNVARDKGRVTFSTTSPKMKDTFVELCHSLGFETAFCRDKRTDYRSGVCYNITVQCGEEWKKRLFTLPGKASLVDDWASRVKRKEHKEFTSIESIEQTDEYEEMTCFTVDSKEGLFLCGDYIVTHNTTFMINFAANMALLGYYTLFISLEMGPKEIFKRYTAMLGNFDATLLHSNVSLWPPDALKRARLVSGKKSPFYGRFEIVDGRKKLFTVPMVEGAVKSWRERLLSEGVPENRIAAVFVDYLGKMDASGLPGINKNSSPYDQERKIMDAMDGLATRQNVILWTATQTNREGFGRAQQSVKNISNSIGAVFPTYLAIALGEPPNEAAASGAQYEFEVETKKTNLLTRVDRKLVITILKSRDAQTEGQYFTVYQGPTLRVWTNRQQATTAMDIASRMSMDELYAALRPVVQTGAGHP